MFHFDNSYLQLPDKCYSKVNPATVKDPELILFNHKLAEDLGLNKTDDSEIAAMLSGKRIPEKSIPFAQAYAGHQFGHFNMLGDGRAILLGEHIDPQGLRFDIQLKGSGQTPYSRRGDGKATLKAMLREYLISEAMYALGIPSSRSLSVVKTGEAVFRDPVQQGAVLARVMKSHIRVGTFEFAAFYGAKEVLKTFFKYTINRLYPDLKNAENPALALLEKVMQQQAELVVNWMRVGFIHGVMNTDNVSISGETFDYGPCAFMNVYDPKTVFSSIDEGGRYAFENQAVITKWNMAKFAETLITLIDEDEKKAVSLAVEQINRFEKIFRAKWLAMMAAKIGIVQPEQDDLNLIKELLELMQVHKADYTNTFTGLYLQDFPKDNPEFWEALLPWEKQWADRIQKTAAGMPAAISLMKKVNPVIIPRNIHVERALFLADKGDMTLFNELLNALQNPYTYNEVVKDLLYFDADFDENYQTFCGT